MRDCQKNKKLKLIEIIKYLFRIPVWFLIEPKYNKSGVLPFASGEMLPKLHTERGFFIISKSISLAEKMIKTMKFPRPEHKDKVLKFSSLQNLLKKIMKYSDLKKQFSAFLRTIYFQKGLSLEEIRTVLKKLDFRNELNQFLYDSFLESGKLIFLFRKWISFHSKSFTVYVKIYSV